MRNRCAAILVLSLCAACFGAVRPQDVVAKVHSRSTPFSTQRLGTAWCLTTDCQLLITNYHVVKFIGPKLKVNGEKVSAYWLATGPDDTDARMMPSFTESYKFNVVRDLAILKVAKPLSSKQMHGVRLFSGELRSGDAVTVLSYAAGKLTETTGHFDSFIEDGILKFALDSPLTAGCSGALILNERDEAVGVLFALDPSLKSAFAVPIWSLAEFIKKIDSPDYAALFPVEPFHRHIEHRLLMPSASTMSAPAMQAVQQAADETNSFVTAATGGLTPSAVLPMSMLNAAELSVPPESRRVESALRTRNPEPREVQALREGAQRMVAQMADFIALQTVLFPDHRVSQHQVRVIDGQQVFIGSDGRELKQLPIPPIGMVPGSEWRDLPQMVGSDLRLPLHYVGEKQQDGVRLRVFQYTATAEDGVCGMRVKRGVLSRTWKGAVPCHGEVWTDYDFNVLRITQDLVMPPQSGLTSSSISVLYGWTHFDSVPARLVPVSMHLEAHDSKQTIQSSATFTNYRMFYAHATIRPN